MILNYILYRKLDKVIVLSNLENKRIISVGSLIDIKGFDRLIDIFNLINKNNVQWSLDIIGDGQLKSKLEEKINMYNINNKKFNIDDTCEKWNMLLENVLLNKV